MTPKTARKIVAGRSRVCTRFAGPRRPNTASEVGSGPPPETQPISPARLASRELFSSPSRPTPDGSRVLPSRPFPPSAVHHKTQKAGRHGSRRHRGSPRGGKFTRLLSPVFPAPAFLARSSSVGWSAPAAAARKLAPVVQFLDARVLACLGKGLGILSFLLCGLAPWGPGVDGVGIR
jgi:hypothetical protein